MGQVTGVAFFPAPMRFMQTADKSLRTDFAALDGKMREAAANIKKGNPQTIVLLSRYRLILPDALGITPQSRLRGVLDVDDGTSLTVGAAVDQLFGTELKKQCYRMGLPLEDILSNVATLSPEHYLLHESAVIPLYYLQEAGLAGKQIIRLTIGRLTYEELYTFGRLMQVVAEKSGRRIAVVGAANLLPVPDTKRADNRLDLNLMALSALADRKVGLLTEVGYPPDDVTCFRVIAFLLGALGGLDASLDIHYYETVRNGGYGLMQYSVKKDPGLRATLAKRTV